MQNPNIEIGTQLKGKTILITGASKGIGSALALGCAGEGASRVAIHYNSDRSGAEAVAAQVEAIGAETLLVQADIGKVGDIEQMMSTLKSQWDHLDVLINNAGLTGWSNLFETTEATWDLVLNTNLKGTFFTSLEVARWMVEKKIKGSIVNVSTNCAALGVRNLVCYATSKAGMHGMTKQLAVELAEHGIRVNTFAPGPVNVERNLKDDPDYRNVWGSVVPLGRTAEADEMVGPAVFLASEASAFVTGQVFYADGGWSVQGKIPIENLDKAANQNS